MKKMSILSVMLFLVSITASAQFSMSTGVSFFSGTGKAPSNLSSNSYAETPTIAGYGLMVFPEYMLQVKDNSSVSVGVPATLGLSGNVNSQTGGSINLSLDLPAVLDYNIGAGSSKENSSQAGGYIGAGLGYTYTSQTYQYVYTSGSETFKGKSFGPLVHAAFKLMIKEKLYFLRASYKFGLEKEKYKTIGIAVGVNL